MPLIPVKQIPGTLGRFVHVDDLRIDLGEDSWRPEMMTIHEVGHFVDWSALPGEEQYASRRWRAWPAMERLILRIRDSDVWPELQDLPAERGLSRPQELFARAYAQWIAWRSGDRRLREQVDLGLSQPQITRRLLQWDYEDFLPIAEALDEMFEGLGWRVRE